MEMVLEIINSNLLGDPINVSDLNADPLAIEGDFQMVTEMVQATLKF